MAERRDRRGNHHGQGHQPGQCRLPADVYSWSFAVVGGRLFFAADDGTPPGGELWVSDGTPAGTAVADINPGGSYAFPASGQVIANVNGSLYFAADDGVHGFEPWVIPASQFVATTSSVRRESIGKSGPTGRPEAVATVPPRSSHPSARTWTARFSERCP